MNQNLIIQEKNYKMKNIVSLIHNNRLQSIHRVLEKHVLSSVKSWADFGCNNGFIIEEIVKANKYQFLKIVGYDHVEGLLELARKKNIPNAVFKCFDLNEVDKVEDCFDLVTCFETLEHVGNFKNAFINLLNHLDEKGVLIITVPNETGFIGLIKFLGRIAVRRKLYHDFFDNQKYFNYMRYLIRNDFIDSFRKSNQTSYSHLGFDYRKLEEYIEEKFIENKQLNLIEKYFTALKMNIIFVFKR
jgi:2-polyprenyl-3-methyl-5-hydroxy-6-metoxy-1,4-benzoquinol methylase